MSAFGRKAISIAVVPVFGTAKKTRFCSENTNMILCLYIPFGRFQPQLTLASGLQNILGQVGCDAPNFQRLSHHTKPSLYPVRGE